MIQDNAIEVLIGLVQSESENTRFWSLKIIGKLLELSQGKAKEQILPYHRFSKHQRFSHDIRAIAIKKRLQQFPLNQATYYILLEILLDLVSPVNIKHPLVVTMTTKLPNLKELYSTQNHSVPIIKNSPMIPIIFEMACLVASLDLQEQVLQGFSSQALS